ELARRGLASWLLVCDEAAPAGMAFATALGGEHAFAEHRLALDPARVPATANPAGPLAFRRAGPPDAAPLAAITAAAFGDPVAEVQGWPTADRGRPARPWSG